MKVSKAIEKHQSTVQDISTVEELLVGPRSQACGLEPYTQLATLAGRRQGRPIELLWQYDGDPAPIIARYFVDKHPAKNLTVSTLDKRYSRHLRTSNIARGFVVLNKGRLIAYGRSPTDTPSISKVSQVVRNEYAGAALTRDGSVQTWGLPDYGGTPQRLVSITDLAATAGAFAALHEDGTVSAWGKSLGGGSAPSLNNISSLASSTYVFAALTRTGGIRTWGLSYAGGGTEPELDDVESFAGTEYACAVRHKDGRVTAWGADETGGVVSPPVHSTVSLHATVESFAVLHENGTVRVWPEIPLNTPPAMPEVTHLTVNLHAFAALHPDGHITTWGIPEFGGAAPALSNVSHVCANEYAFAARHHDGTVTAWGVSKNGGAIPEETASELRDIVVIYGCSLIFIALRADGQVFAWGDAASLPTAEQLQYMQGQLSYFEER